MEVDERWRKRAACRDLDPDLFFVEQGQAADRARDICDEQCPVRVDCLEYAISAREEFGIWGGMNKDERRRFQRNRKRKAKT